MAARQLLDYNSPQVTGMKQDADNYTVQVTYTLGRTRADSNIGGEKDATSVPDMGNPRVRRSRSQRSRAPGARDV